MSLASDLLAIMYSIIAYFMPDEKESPLGALVGLILSYVMIVIALGFSQMVSDKVCIQTLCDRKHHKISEFAISCDGDVVVNRVPCPSGDS